VAAGQELEEATLAARRLGGRLAIADLVGPVDYPRLVELLRRRGFDSDAPAAILAGNWLRFLKRALPG
jgi:microsomal dipeptidase-like Zn-dependent dipeptidase